MGRSVGRIWKTCWHQKWTLGAREESTNGTNRDNRFAPRSSLERIGKRTIGHFPALIFECIQRSFGIMEGIYSIFG